MDDKGFAMPCPHCGEPNVQEHVHPDDVALDSKAEFRQIMNSLCKASLRGKQDAFSHPKLFRCKSPRRLCPASFEAFVCRSEQDAFAFLGDVEAWSLKRDFRLYKSDCKKRWQKKEEGKYYGILFCSQPVPRQGDIELMPLMSSQLLQRLIVSMSVEIKSPLTIYAAKVFKPKGTEAKTYWIPVEAYTHGELLVPPRFNVFCHTCRKLVVERLATEFEEKQIGPYNCCFRYWDSETESCAGKRAGCIQSQKDWNRCPIFITEREKRCPCYQSDCILIRKVEDYWRRGKQMKRGVEHRCFAGFREVGFPIIIHQHLAGVVFTGQVFFSPKEISAIDAFVDQWDILKGCQDDLESAKQELVRAEHDFRRNNNATFFISKEMLNQRKNLLSPNLEVISEMPNTSYREIRTRAESAFTQEVLGFTRNHRDTPDFFKRHILHVLRRMRDFWAFKGVHLLGFSSETKDISLIAFNTKERKDSFGIPGKQIGRVDIRYEQMHPCPYLHRMGGPTPRNNPLLRVLIPRFERAIDESEFGLQKGKYYFFAIIPSFENVYAFIFAVRDETAVCSLEPLVPGDVSKLCQEAILDACTRVTYEFGEIRNRETSEIMWAGRVVHHMREPLQGLMAELNEIKRLVTRAPITGQKIAKIAKYVGDMTRETFRLGMVNKNLQYLGGIKDKKVNLRRVDVLRDVVRLVLEALERQAKRRNLKFRVDKASEVVIRSDSDLLRIILYNVVHNAAKFATVNSEIVIHLGEGSKGLFVEIVNEGPEIEKGERTRIFNRNYQGKVGKETVTGLGNGLYIARRVADDLGCCLDLISTGESDGKTTFRLHLLTGLQ